MNYGWGGSKDGYYSLNSQEGWNYIKENMIINIKPDRGGTPDPHEIALQNFTASKTSVSQNELFTVTEQMQNISTLDTFPGGQFGAALVDNNGKIEVVIGITNYPYSIVGGGANWGSPRNINCFVPGDVAPRQYQLRIVTKVEGEDWKLVDLSAIRDGVPKSIPITVTAGEANGGGYGIMLERFEPNIISVSQNGSFEVIISLRNIGLEAITSCDVGIALEDNSGNFEVIRTSANWNNFTGGTGTIRNCIVPATVPTRQYQLRIALKPAGKEEWKIATMSNTNNGTPTSYDFTVQ
jgi:hypothetical protein